MFDKTSRSVYEEGLRFYEEDILFDSHIYHANQKVKMELCYNKNGVGLIIGLMPGQPLEKQNLYYFLRLDAFSASLFLVNQMHYERLQHISTPISAPQERLKIEIHVKTNEIVLFLNGRKFMHKQIDYAIGDHHVGIYSERDNIFYKMSIDGKSALLWQTNMQATENGRITFKDNEVRFSNCKFPAELVQDDIMLTKGEYYINYEGEGADVYVYDTRSPFIKLEDKNMIRDNGLVVLEDDATVAVHISSKHGNIKNIRLSSIPNAPYIETYLNPTVKDASYFKVDLKDIKAIEIRFNILRECFATLLTDELQSYERGFIEGDHKLLYENGVFYLYYKDQYIDEITSYGDVIYLLKGVEAFIYILTITTKDGKVIDWFDKKDRDNWIKPSLNSPILATNENNQPLDLSASFRKIKDRFIFTNSERESFDPNPILQLQKQAIAIDGIYAIPRSAITHDEAYYNGKEEDYNDITSYCKNYVPIHNATLDKYLNQVIIYDNLYEYKEIIVDYRKEDSYAINFVTEIGQYNVSSTAPYCTYIYSEDGQEQYAITNYKEEENQYIVLEKGDFYEN